MLEGRIEQRVDDERGRECILFKFAGDCTLSLNCYLEGRRMIRATYIISELTLNCRCDRLILARQGHLWVSLAWIWERRTFNKTVQHLVEQLLFFEKTELICVSYVCVFGFKAPSCLKIGTLEPKGQVDHMHWHSFNSARHVTKLCGDCLVIHDISHIWKLSGKRWQAETCWNTDINGIKLDTAPNELLHSFSACKFAAVPCA